MEAMERQRATNRSPPSRVAAKSPVLVHGTGTTVNENEKESVLLPRVRQLDHGHGAAGDLRQLAIPALHRLVLHESRGQTLRQ
jgi:hypothetical protein